MLTAKDYHRAATYLLSRYGSDALERAANRASELRASGEAGLQRIWDVLFETLREIDKAGKPGARMQAVGERAART